MTTFIEIGKDNQAILWQPHLLTDAMEARRLDALALEPLLNPPAIPGAALFKVESNETSVKWAWDNWTRVEIRADQVNGPGAPKIYVKPQPPDIRWNELPASRAVDLTFYAADGVAGGSVRIEVPYASTFGRDVEFGQPRGGTILVRLLNPKDSAGMSVERLKLGQNREFRPKGSPIPFRTGESSIRVPVPSDFFGIIAVVRNRRGRRYLIGYAHYNGMKTVLPNLSHGIDADEFQKVSRWIEGNADVERQRREEKMTAEEWLDNWPLNSRTSLGHLLEQARRHLDWTGDDAYQALRAYPTGLLRYFTLFQCGYSSPDPEKSIRRLNEGSFKAALSASLPSLAGALALLSSPEEKVWAVRHADNPNLTDAAAWAGTQGVAALERALHLLDKRSEAITSWEARMRRVRPKSVLT